MSSDSFMDKKLSLGKALTIIVASLVVIVALVFVVPYIASNQFDKTPKKEKDLKAASAKVEKNPKSVMAHIQLGMEYTNQDQPEKALTEFEKAYDLSEKEKKEKDPNITSKMKDEDSYNARSNLGYGYIGVKKYKEAIKILEQFTKEFPIHNQSHYNLAYAYYSDGQNEKAVNAFTEFLKLDPGAADGYYFLALSYEKIGNKEAALKNIDQALKLVPNYKDYLDAKSRMSK